MTENTKIVFSKRTKKAKLPTDTSEEQPARFDPVKRQKIKSEDNSLFSFASSSNEIAPTSIDSDASVISQARAQKEISDKIYSGELSSSIYRGQKGYALYSEKSDSSIRASKYTGSLGPIQAPSHLRATCRFDYSYGLCKDWKISGYCGYGDSCIFVHDRSELKTGWELEKEWEKEQEEKRKRALEQIERKAEEEAEEKPEEKIKGCEKCGQTVEVSTICKHLFCYKCSIELMMKSTKCYVCKKDTKGIVNDLR